MSEVKPYFKEEEKITKQITKRDSSNRSCNPRKDREEAPNIVLDDLKAIMESLSPKKQAELLSYYNNPAKGGKPVRKSHDLLFLESISKEDSIRIKYGSDFYEWRENHWHRVSTSFIEKMAHKFLGDESSTSKLTSCGSMVASQATSLKKTANRDDVIIPLKNKYVTITDDGKLKEIPIDKDYNFCYYINADYDNMSRGPLFDHFLRTSIPDQGIQDLLQEYVGYSLIQNINKGKMLFLTGGGGDGKSVFIDLVTALHFRTVAVEPDNLDGFQLNRILDATLCTAAETDKKIMEQALKKLVTGDLINVQRKYKDDIPFRNQSRFIFSCNELPHIMDSSAGFWRRMFIVPFDNPPKEEDKIDDLAEQIKANELDYVLTWAINGLMRLKANNWVFTESKAIVEKTRNYQVETNSCLSYLSQFKIMETPECETKTTDMFDDYKFFCAENNLRPFSNKKFALTLQTEVKATGISMKKIAKRCDIEVNGVIKNAPRPHVNIDLVYKGEVTDYIRHRKVCLKQLSPSDEEVKF